MYEGLILRTNKLTDHLMQVDQEIGIHHKAVLFRKDILYLLNYYMQIEYKKIVQTVHEDCSHSIMKW